jgi:predicted nucleic acid-binding protein
MILDTNAISALADQDKVLTDLVQAAPRIAVTIISLGEYAFGISQSRHRVELEAWLDALLLKVDVLLLEQKTLPFYAEVRGRLKVAGTQIPANDCWIAALAQQHRLPIVSQDRHFDSVKGIQRIGWCESEGSGNIS